MAVLERSVPAPWLAAENRRLRRRWLMLRLIAVSVKPECFPSRAPVHPAPLGGRDAHLVLKRALEGGLGLVAGKLSDSAGRHVQCLERVGGDRHADVSQQLAGRTAETLLKVTNEGGARHVAALRELGKGPGAGGLVEEGDERGHEAGISCNS